MKLLAVRVARSIWLVPRNFLNPRGAFTQAVIEAIKNRYSFFKSPLDNPPPPVEAHKYEGGKFNGKRGDILIVSMALHNDGIVVDTRSSTDDGDAFLEDMISWVGKEYSLPSHTELPIKKLYASELNVVFSNSPAIFNSKLTPFLNAVSSAIGNDKIGKADFLGFHLGTDQTRSKAPFEFKFEREVNTTFEENRYYSFSPTKTEIHIKLLEQLEQLAT